MREKITINNSKLIDDQELILQTEDSINELNPTGQMLVDSDHLSFIYIAEKNDVYTYIALHEETWANLKTALELKIPVFIANESEKLELVGIIDELQYLIENIKGNSNYGEEMVTKVEYTF